MSSASDADLIERISRIPTAPGRDAVDKLELKRRLGLESEYLAGRILAQFDANRDGVVTRDELVRGVTALSKGEPLDKLRFAFGLHDEDGNGFIDRRELERMLHIALAENRLVFGDACADALVDALFAKADANTDGKIAFSELVAALSAYPSLFEHMTLGDLRWLGLGEPPRAASAPLSVTIPQSVRSHALSFALGLLYVALCAGLFAEAMLRYRAMGGDLMLQIARGCGACLNLHGGLLLVPMTRASLTRLGRTRWGRILVDDHVWVHRVLGDVAFAFGVVHSAAHLVRFSLGLSGGWLALTSLAGVTGVIVLLVHGVMWLFARERIRRSGRFELFAYTHRLWPLWVGLMLLHGPVAWIWMVPGLLLYGFDRIFGRKLYRTRVIAADVLSSGVTRLTIARPRAFGFRASDYVFACIPALSRGEWHPFTISSAPERPDVLTLHVRASGNWTRALRELAGSSKSEIAITIDGPYGTPTARVFEADRVLRGAAGIGVTPFAAVLESLLAQRRRGGWPKPTRVHFVWVCNDANAFGWFAELLGELEISLLEAFDVHIYMDAGRRDMRSAILRVAMDALYARTKGDVVTGLRSRTTLGPPDWDALVAKLAGAHDSELRTFYCGPPGLASKVRAACMRAGVPFRQEHF